MFAATRAVAARTVRSQVQSRSLVTATKPKMGPHPTFTPPYSKPLVAAIVWGTFTLGFIIPPLSVKYQNKKHGFAK